MLRELQSCRERMCGQALEVCRISCVCRTYGAKTLQPRSSNAAVQTTQTQIAAFLVAAGNAVQYVREDEAVQLSTTVSLCMGFRGLSRRALQPCSPSGVMSQDLHFLAMPYVHHLLITGVGASIPVSLCMDGCHNLQCSCKAQSRLAISGNMAVPRGVES